MTTKLHEQLGLPQIEKVDKEKRTRLLELLHFRNKDVLFEYLRYLRPDIYPMKLEGVVQDRDVRNAIKNLKVGVEHLDYWTVFLKEVDIDRHYKMAGEGVLKELAEEHSKGNTEAFIYEGKLYKEYTAKLGYSLRRSSTGTRTNITKTFIERYNKYWDMYKGYNLANTLLINYVLFRSSHENMYIGGGKYFLRRNALREETNCQAMNTPLWVYNFFSYDELLRTSKEDFRGVYAYIDEVTGKEYRTLYDIRNHLKIDMEYRIINSILTRDTDKDLQDKIVTGKDGTRYINKEILHKVCKKAKKRRKKSNSITAKLWEMGYSDIPYTSYQVVLNKLLTMEEKEGIPREVHIKNLLGYYQEIGVQLSKYAEQPQYCFTTDGETSRTQEDTARITGLYNNEKRGAVVKKVITGDRLKMSKREFLEEYFKEYPNDRQYLVLNEELMRLEILQISDLSDMDTSKYTLYLPNIVKEGKDKEKIDYDLDNVFLIDVASRTAYYREKIKEGLKNDTTNGVFKLEKVLTQEERNRLMERSINSDTTIVCSDYPSMTEYTRGDNKKAYEVLKELSKLYRLLDNITGELKESLSDKNLIKLSYSGSERSQHKSVVKGKQVKSDTSKGDKATQSSKNTGVSIKEYLSLPTNKRLSYLITKKKEGHHLGVLYSITRDRYLTIDTRQKKSDLVPRELLKMPMGYLGNLGYFKDLHKILNFNTLLNSTELKEQVLSVSNTSETGYYITLEGELGNGFTKKSLGRGTLPNEVYQLANVEEENVVLNGVPISLPVYIEYLKWILSLYTTPLDKEIGDSRLQAILKDLTYRELNILTHEEVVAEE